MNIRRNEEGEGEIINMSSLLDVLFILIIFFVATSTFQEQERDQNVQLPDAAKEQQLSAKTDTLIVNVRQDGSYYFGSAVAPSLDDLQAKLVAAREIKEDRSVLVRGDRRAVHGAVADALKVCKQAGFADAKIGYQEGK